MTTYSFDTKFIADIDPDPAFIDRMIRRIDEALTDELGDFAWQIATDYIDAPADADASNPDAYEDAVAEQVINPLMDHIMRHIVAKLITG